MKKIKEFFLELQLRLWLALQGTKQKLASENGDTNFISIAIILIVVIALAVVFISFKDSILTGLNSAIKELLDKLGIKQE